MKSRQPEEFRVRIDKLVYGGDGLGRRDGRVIFVPFSAPGDTLLVRAFESRKGFARAEIREILQPGPLRHAPACRHFGVCGGCHWQHLEYCAQIEAKRNSLVEVLEHRFPETRGLGTGMKVCPEEYGYRSRTRIQVRQSASGLSLGFYRMRSHAVEQIEACPLLRPSLNSTLDALRRRLQKHPPASGMLELEIAGSEDTQTWACTAQGPEGEPENFSDLPGAAGDGLVVRKVHGFSFLVSPSAFFQANDFMVSALVSCVMSLVQEAAPQIVLDLYSGVGLFSLPLAQRFQRVFAVESAPLASRLCQANATAAGLNHIQVIQAEAHDWLGGAGASPANRVDLVLLNPPRAGAGRTVMDLISRLTAETVIYVSCDPQTLARDLMTLCERGYHIDFAEGLDLFPQTYHFETVVRLRRG